MYTEKYHGMTGFNKDIITGFLIGLLSAGKFVSG
jgi:hypothetical protein